MLDKFFTFAFSISSILVVTLALSGCGLIPVELHSSVDEEEKLTELVEHNYGITDESSREEILDALEQSLTDLVEDALMLQIEWQKLEAGDVSDCTIEFIRPQPLELTEGQIGVYQDVANIVTDPEGDYQSSFDTYLAVLSLWDSYCSGTLTEADQIGNVDRLRQPIAMATGIRANVIPELRSARPEAPTN